MFFSTVFWLQNSNYVNRPAAVTLFLSVSYKSCNVCWTRTLQNQRWMKTHVPSGSCYWGWASKDKLTCLKLQRRYYWSDLNVWVGSFLEDKSWTLNHFKNKITLQSYIVQMWIMRFMLVFLLQCWCNVKHVLLICLPKKFLGKTF